MTSARPARISATPMLAIVPIAAAGTSDAPAIGSALGPAIASEAGAAIMPLAGPDGALATVLPGTDWAAVPGAGDDAWAEADDAAAEAGVGEAGAWARTMSAHAT